MNYSTFVRPHLLTLEGYRSARSEYIGEAILLDANESPYPSELNRYPDPNQHTLREIMGKLRIVNPDKIIVGNGSDEIIDLLIRACCQPAVDKVAVVEPTYGMYRVCAGINNVEAISIPMDRNFSLNVDNVLTQIADCKLLFLCNPGNPTANVIPQLQIEKLLEQFPGLVVIDEAYYDFAEMPTSISLLDAHPNLFVIQTLSKAWGLASARVGFGFGAIEFISILGKIKPPYNVSGISQKQAVYALQQPELKAERTRKINAEKIKLAKMLSELHFVTKVFSSATNFLLVRFKNSQSVFLHLKETGIVVRDRSSLAGCENCLRISIGTADENKTLIEALNRLK